MNFRLILRLHQYFQTWQMKPKLIAYSKTYVHIAGGFQWVSILSMCKILTLNWHRSEKYKTWQHFAWFWSKIKVKINEYKCHYLDPCIYPKSELYSSRQAMRIISSFSLNFWTYWLFMHHSETHQLWKNAIWCLSRIHL